MNDPQPGGENTTAEHIRDNCCVQSVYRPSAEWMPTVLLNAPRLQPQSHKKGNRLFLATICIQLATESGWQRIHVECVADLPASACSSCICHKHDRADKKMTGTWEWLQGQTSHSIQIPQDFTGRNVRPSLTDPLKKRQNDDHNCGQYHQ